jgi:type II secretory pathway pseudopilin PulG
MKRIVMAIMAVAVTFSVPAFAGDEKTEKKDEKKGATSSCTAMRRRMRRASKRDGIRLSDQASLT